MITLVLDLFRLLPFLLGGHRQLALENLALRQQLAVYKRTVKGPRLRRTDRLFWIGLARLWAGWKQPLVIVTPDTVLRWQRRRFREYWTRLSGRPARGRPPINAQIKLLVTRMAAANPLWGAPRIHGELLKLGFDVAERPHAEGRILTRYLAYYHRARTHLALDKDTPDLRPVERPEVGRIVQLPEVGGLHHRYLRQAA